VGVNLCRAHVLPPSNSCGADALPEMRANGLLVLVPNLNPHRMLAPVWKSGC